MPHLVKVARTRSMCKNDNPAWMVNCYIRLFLFVYTCWARSWGWMHRCVGYKDIIRSADSTRRSLLILPIHKCSNEWSAARERKKNPFGIICSQARTKERNETKRFPTRVSDHNRCLIIPLSPNILLRGTRSSCVDTTALCFLGPRSRRCINNVVRNLSVEWRSSRLIYSC